MGVPIAAAIRTPRDGRSHSAAKYAASRTSRKQGVHHLENRRPDAGMWARQAAFQGNGLGLREAKAAGRAFTRLWAGIPGFEGGQS